MVVVFAWKVRNEYGGVCMKYLVSYCMTIETQPNLKNMLTIQAYLGDCMQ